MWHAEKKHLQVLVGKDDGRRQFERPRNRREDNIKLILLK
jgi:hypothetical protein